MTAEPTGDKSSTTRFSLKTLVCAPRRPMDVAEGTVFRIKRRFAEEGLAVLQRLPEAG